MNGMILLLIHLWRYHSQRQYGLLCQGLIFYSLFHICLIFRNHNQSMNMFMSFMFCFTVFREVEGSLNWLTWQMLVIQTCIKDSFVLVLLGVENPIYLPRHSKSIKDKLITSPTFRWNNWTRQMMLEYFISSSALIYRWILSKIKNTQTKH